MSGNRVIGIEFNDIKLSVLDIGNGRICYRIESTPDCKCQNIDINIFYKTPGMRDLVETTLSSYDCDNSDIIDTIIHCIEQAEHLGYILPDADTYECENEQVYELPILIADASSAIFEHFFLPELDKLTGTGILLVLLRVDDGYMHTVPINSKDDVEAVKSIIGIRALARVEEALDIMADNAVSLMSVDYTGLDLTESESEEINAKFIKSLIFGEKDTKYDTPKTSDELKGIDYLKKASKIALTGLKKAVASNLDSDSIVKARREAACEELNCSEEDLDIIKKFIESRKRVYK